jgi:hypothetical protein
MIKIVSGFSDPGGSTEAFINLTNLLNKHGMETCFYGPHKFHLDKCNAKSLNSLVCNNQDVFICHYTYNLPFLCKKKIFSCHERSNFFNLKPIAADVDYIHFVSENQKCDHNLSNVKSFVLPNIISEINIQNKPNMKIGGVIGTIFPLKNTHISIQMAINDGCEAVLVYGNIGDKDYFNKNVLPLIDNKRVFYFGWVVDKTKIYSSVTDVYHFSDSETWGYIEGECYVTGTNFHKNKNLTNFTFMPNDDIIKKWIEIINE